MSKKHVSVALAALALALLTTVPAAAQPANQSQHIFTPLASPRAEVAQTVGMTEIRVVYHRPAVNERDVWKAVIPRDGTPVWRTGANENTLVSFSTDVKVQGQPLAAGTYSLHTVPGTDPGQDEWTIVFNKDIHAWGSFSYQEENDALRVEATPRKVPHQERFAIAFDALAADGTDMDLRWAEVEVPVRVEVDLEKTVLASFEQQLTGLSQFFWQGWNQAAQYALANDLALEEAVTWADRSIAVEERFNNLSTKAALLRELERGEEAETVMARALEIANAGQLHGYGRQLLAQGKMDEAKKIFDANLERHPDTWFVTVGPARYYSAMGDFEKAAAQMKTALDRAPDNRKAAIGALLEQLQAGQSI